MAKFLDKMQFSPGCISMTLVGLLSSLVVPAWGSFASQRTNIHAFSSPDDFSTRQWLPVEVVLRANNLQRNAIPANQITILEDHISDEMMDFWEKEEVFHVDIVQACNQFDDCSSHVSKRLRAASFTLQTAKTAKERARAKHRTSKAVLVSKAQATKDKGSKWHARVDSWWDFKMIVYSEDEALVRDTVRDRFFLLALEGRLRSEFADADLDVGLTLGSEFNEGEDGEEEEEEAGEEEEGFLSKYMLPIIGGGAGALILVLCCVLYCCCFRNTKQPQSPVRSHGSRPASSARPSTNLQPLSPAARYGSNGHANGSAALPPFASVPPPAALPPFASVPPPAVIPAERVVVPGTVVGAAMGAQAVVPFEDLRMERALAAWRGAGAVKEVHKAKCFQGDAVCVRVRGGWVDLRALSTRMTALSQHPYINAFLGAAKAPQGDAILLMQWLPRGSLRSFLQEHVGFLSVPERLDACRQVCDAMSFLAGKGETHGYLAACNVLVVSFYPANVQLTDYGLCGLPGLKDASDPRLARWTAPENIQTGAFSLPGDVWSFGVLMWEVFADGALPFSPNHPSDHEVMTFVESGGRLEKPSLAPAAVYAQMWKCWREVAERPRMSELLAMLQAWKGRDLAQEEEDGAGAGEEEEETDAGLAEAGLCQMCLDAPRTVLCLPCRHASLCHDCFDMVMEKDRLCVICRTYIEGSEGGKFMQTFLRSDKLPVPGTVGV